MKFLRIFIFSAFAIALTFNSVVLYKLYRDTKTIKGEVDTGIATINSIHSKVASIGSMPLALAETPNGLSLVAANHGVTYSDLEFLSRFRGPLLTKSQYHDDAGQIDLLKHTIELGYSKEKSALSEYFHDDQSSRVAYALLRVHGSMPVYAVRSRYSRHIADALLRPSGNCSDFSLRLMLVLESMGLKAAMISNVTTNLPGHVFVDAYDPTNDAAYLLDANFNVMIEMPRTGGKGFIESLFKLRPDERKALAREIKIYTFPVYFRYVDPGDTAYVRTPITRDLLNELRSEREATWREWLANDLDELRQWWRKAPGHAPNTLNDIRKKGLADIPAVYDRSGNYALAIKIAAGLESR